ncbi:alpha/beta-Hydrolases superfamily protein [Thalictrum thalictroides]|uniref:Alpha/beta-Hydrolases superfamily protein n=1 Tax=Thalictrum thalictroides TaxID=46969 RepID=A0A7J6WV69_THATH|nr:alpha/beta-Hydrolases superfamily protein [Thalictrum thalictroides]
MGTEAIHIRALLGIWKEGYAAWTQQGWVDVAAALSVYSLKLKDKVAGLALVQSPYGGSSVASNVLPKGQIADKETRNIMELLISKLI